MRFGTANGNGYPICTNARPAESYLRSILVIKLSSLGDIVLCMPTVSQLKRMTGARITWIIDEGIASLLVGHPDCDELLLFPRNIYDSQTGPYASQMQSFVRLLRNLRSRHFDLAVDFQGRGRSYFLLQLARAKKKIGRGRFPFLHLSIAHLWQKKRHAAESYLEVCDCLGLPRPSSDAALLLGNKASRHRIRCLLHAQGLASPLVILVPASSWPSKCWPTGHWAATAEWLLEQGYSVALLGSCREEAVGREIAKQISNQRKTAFLFGVLKLGDLPALFESSRLVITGDTGPMHVAAASGAAVLALFGPTDPSLTGPWPAGKAMVLRAPLCDCCKRPRCPKACMRNIRPDRVISAIEAML